MTSKELIQKIREIEESNTGALPSSIKPVVDSQREFTLAVYQVALQIAKTREDFLRKPY